MYVVRYFYAASCLRQGLRLCVTRAAGVPWMCFLHAGRVQSYGDTDSLRCRVAGEDWVKMDDSRFTCLQCLHTLVRNTPDAQPLYDDVLRFYASMSMVRPPGRRQSARTYALSPSRPANCCS